jgi:hypothetical protein
MTVEDVALSFDYLLGHRKWRAKGLSSNQIQQWCEDNKRPFYVIYKDDRTWKVKESLQEDPRGRSIAFAAVESHCFMYKDAHILARLVKEGGLEDQFGHQAVFNLQCDVEPIIRGLYEKATKKTPEVRDWEEWDSVIRPGFFLPPTKVSCSSYAESGYSQLTIECIELLDKASGTCVIKEIPKEREKIQAWLDAIYETTGERIKWQGEGLPNLTLEVFKKLLRAGRVKLTPAQKVSIREAQNQKCAMCEEADIDEFDHVKPLKATTRGCEQVFQGLCGPCHAKVTKYESDKVCIESTFSPFACQAYRDSPRAPALMMIANKQHKEGGDEAQITDKDLKEKGLYCIDIRRCRFNAMMHYDLPDFPVFCVLDNIEPLDITRPKFQDLNYVEIPERPWKVPTCNEPQDCIVGKLPLHGSAWYPELICRHAMNAGLITWSDVKLTYKATGRIKLESVQEVLEVMESCWEGDDLKKTSWNSAVGCMAKEFSQIFRVVTKESELPSYGTTLKVYNYKGKNGEDLKLYDWTTPVPTISCFSYRPLWDCIIAWEHVKVACMIMAMEMNAGIPKRDVLQLKTDAVLVDSGKRGKKRKALEAVENMSYEEVGKLSNNRALAACTYPVRAGEDAPIYQKGTAKKLRGQKYDKVKRNAVFQTLTKTWTDIALMVGDVYDFTALFKHILDGKNCYIDGMPGGGKTTIGQELVAMLRRAGKKVQVIGKTNACLRRFGEGKTADKWLFFHVTKGLGLMPDVLFVEEISLIGLNLWTSICTAFMSGKHKKIQVIL